MVKSCLKGHFDAAPLDDAPCRAGEGGFFQLIIARLCPFEFQAGIVYRMVRSRIFIVIGANDGAVVYGDVIQGRRAFRFYDAIAIRRPAEGRLSSVDVLRAIVDLALRPIDRRL